MILEKKLSFPISQIGDCLILNVAFHGYCVELHQDDNGVRAGKAEAWYIEDALHRNELPKGFLYDHIADMEIGEIRIVNLEKKVDREICDGLFQSKLLGHKIKAIYELESLAFEAIHD